MSSNPLLAVGLVFALGCSGTVHSGVAVAKIGADLEHHAGAVQGGEVCLVQEAIAAPPGSGDKAMSDACTKALKSDKVWRKSLVVLAAYGETLETLALDEAEDTTGQVEAARTGVTGPESFGAADGAEKAAADAGAALVTQMSTNSSKGDLEKAIQDAAPHVNSICDGLTAYLGTQVKGLSEAQTEIEKKRTSKLDRRCGSLDNRSICVAESTVDRAVYANAFGQLAKMELDHEDARAAVAGFCAAHKKLESAAAAGNLKEDSTYGEIVDAIKSGHQGGAAPAAPEPAPTPSPASPEADKK